MHFINPKNDIAFKKIFGDQNHHDILLEFLNQVLQLDDPILDVQIMNPYQLPRIAELKLTALDIKARDKKHEFLIEMQVENENWFAQRVTFYSCKAYTSQLGKGQNYSKLKPVVFLGVVNFKIFEGNEVITRHLSMNQSTQRNDLKQMEFNFIELPKFNKTEEELTTLTDQWLYFLKNAEKLETIPKSVTSEHLLSAYQTLEEHSWSKEELEVYEYWMMKEHTYENALETAKLVSKAEGEAHKANEIAFTMLKKGVDIDLISEFTGLSLKEIEQIKEKIN